jgi:hypothetical protein
MQLLNEFTKPLDGNIIQAFDKYLDEDDPWKGILAASTAFAIRATYHTTLQKSPGKFVFVRDMIFNIQHTENWEYIRAQKQRLIQKNNKNKKQILNPVYLLRQ